MPQSGAENDAEVNLEYWSREGAQNVPLFLDKRGTMKQRGENMNCDECERKLQCYHEGRLITFTTLDDQYIIPELDNEAHAILGIGKICPKQK